MAPPQTNRLFAGRSFWLSQKIPDRKRLISLINDHGGATVLREKDAHILLANGESTNVPEGSVSFAWVDACLDQGELVDTDPFRVVGRLGVRPKKSTRTPFTATEDSLLVEYVRGRQATRGRALFQQLEPRLPRHTWQSLRDRYDKIKDLPQYKALPPTPKFGGDITLPSIGTSDPSRTLQPQPQPQPDPDPNPDRSTHEKATGLSQHACDPRPPFQSSPRAIRQMITQAIHPDLSPPINRTTPHISPKATLPSASQGKRKRQASPLISTPRRKRPSEVPITSNSQISTSLPPINLPAPANTCNSTLTADLARPSNQDEIHAWLRECDERGFSSELAARGFFHTTMVPGILACTAMENLRKHGSVPSNHEGIWTVEDDECLRRVGRTALDVFFANSLNSMQSHQELDRLLLKHGRRNIDLRARFHEDLDALLNQEE